MARSSYEYRVEHPDTGLFCHPLTQSIQGRCVYRGNIKLYGRFFFLLFFFFLLNISDTSRLGNLRVSDIKELELIVNSDFLQRHLFLLRFLQEREECVVDNVVQVRVI